MEDQLTKLDRAGGAASSVHRWSRAGLLRRAGLVGATVSAGGVLIARRALDASSAPSDDARVLQFALIVERLQEAFYKEANKNGALKGEVAEFSRTAGAHESEHVAFITKALAGAAAKPPIFDFGDTTSNEKKFVSTAVELEDLGLAAYNGQATNLSPKTLAAAARIVSVEARHAAWIRDLAGDTPAPRASDQPLTEAQVRAELKKTGFVKS
jgi:hypothetical protein